jgi:hypothetical protein
LGLLPTPTTQQNSNIKLLKRQYNNDTKVSLSFAGLSFLTGIV